MSPRHHPGRHELGQNHLVDRRVIARIVDLVAQTRGPIVEWAAGDGALTRPLAALGRPLEAVEIDPRCVRRLSRSLPPHVCITEGDILRHAPPSEPYVLVCNVPFHITTAVLRRLLALPGWSRAVLITQWEVARKRAAVGGATQLTAQWWPWFEFDLVSRIPATAFAPRPSVDAGLLLVRRRERPLVADRGRYQRWVKDVLTGRGKGMPQILVRSGGMSAQAARQWCARQGVTTGTLPKDLSAHQWADAYARAVSPRESSPLTARGNARRDGSRGPGRVRPARRE